MIKLINRTIKEDGSSTTHSRFLLLFYFLKQCKWKHLGQCIQNNLNELRNGYSFGILY